MDEQTSSSDRSPGPSVAEPARRRPARALAAVGVALVLAVLAAAGFQAARELAEARAIESDLAARLAATGERIEALRGRVERLRDDPAILERLAREELGLVRPGDVVIVLPEEGPAGGGGEPGEAVLPAPPEAPGEPAATSPQTAP